MVKKTLVAVGALLMVAALARLATMRVAATPTRTNYCSNCHPSDPGTTISVTVADQTDTDITYQISGSTGLDGGEGWGVFDPTGPRLDGAFGPGTITLPKDGLTYRFHWVDMAFDNASFPDGAGARADVTTPVVVAATFDDVPTTSPLWPYVEVLVAAGVTTGCSAAPPLYCPDATVTRAQMAKFLCIAAGKLPFDRPAPSFADVPKTAWFYGWVERLADTASWGGIPPTGGCRADNPATPENEALFCPYSPITRAQMAVFLCRAAGRSLLNSTVATFADVPSPYWAYGYVERLVDAPSWGGTAVTGGCVAGPPRLYCPVDPVTRGQMAVFLVRAFTLP